MAKIAIGGPSYWARNQFTINASSSLQIFTQDEIVFRGLKAHISVYNSSNSNQYSFDYNLTLKNSEAIDSVYDKKGDIMNLQINSINSGGNVSITIVNNELNDVEINFYSLSLN